MSTATRLAELGMAPPLATEVGKQFSIGDPVARAQLVGINSAGDGITSPATNLSYAAGGAGALTGAFGYNVTFVTALGETPPWSGTPAQVTLSSQQMALSGIPVGPAGTIKRRIYRSKANSVEPKNTFFLAEIVDNTTTTFTDNAADALLSVPANWIGTNYGTITTADGIAVSFGNSGSVVLGGSINGSFQPKASYAAVSIGGGAGSSGISAFRCVYVGIYAGTLTTTGVENTGIGTHAGASVTTGTSNVFLGAYNGLLPGGAPVTVGAQSFNTCIGHGVMNNATAMGQSCVLVGYRAGYNLNSADNITALGAYAGAYANASRQIFLDSGGDRGSLANAQAKGLIYGKSEGTEYTQVLDINAKARAGAKVTVANLGTATLTDVGRRAVVTDSSVAFTSANIGTAVAGAGSHTVPVICVTTGTGATYAWAIG